MEYEIKEPRQCVLDLYNQVNGYDLDGECFKVKLKIGVIDIDLSAYADESIYTIFMEQIANHCIKYGKELYVAEVKRVIGF